MSGRTSRSREPDNRREHGRRRDSNDQSGGGTSTVPEVNAIFQGTVVSIMDYGAFVRIPGCIKNGLVHKSQLSKCRVDHVNEVVSVNDRVWCKVISLGEDSNKISLSMKSVNQGTGADLDPNGVQAGLDENRRKTFTPFSQPKIELEAVLNTVCKKCNTKGHLAHDCFQASSGKGYQLIEDDDDDEKPAGFPTNEGTVNETRKKEHKKHKGKKHKEQKKRKSSKKSRAHSSSDHSDTAASAGDKNSSSAGGKKRKRERHTSSSSSSSEASTKRSKQRKEH